MKFAKISAFILGSILIILVISSCTPGGKVIDPSRRKPVPPEKMLCVFRSDIDEEYNYEIYLLRVDKKGMGENGELVTRLTETPSPAAEVFPTIARDCNTVVYCSSVNDMGSNPFFPDFDLFKVMADTKQVTGLTDTGQEQEYAPSISADGKIVTFMVKSFMKGGASLYMMNLDKPTERILIQENLGQNVYPRISADGKFVVYAAPTGATKKNDIFLVNLETRQVKNLTRTPDIEEYYPDISDDKQIVIYQVNDAPPEEKKEGIPPTAGVNGQPPAEPSGEQKTPPAETGKEPPAETGNDGGIFMAQAGKEGGDKEAGSGTEPGAGAPPAQSGPGTPPAGTPPEETGEQPAPQAQPPAETKKEGDWEIWVLNMKSGQKLQVTNNDFNDLYPVISGDGTYAVYTSAREDLNGDKQDEFVIYMTDLISMQETLVSTQPFHHDTIEISW